MNFGYPQRHVQGHERFIRRKAYFSIFKVRTTRRYTFRSGVSVFPWSDYSIAE
nr:MAG TPA: hypothetical protein [Caudoviricetes sp.]